MSSQLDLQLETHGHVGTPKRKILLLDQLPYPINASPNGLKNSQYFANSGLAATVFAYKQD